MVTESHIDILTDCYMQDADALLLNNEQERDTQPPAPERATDDQ